MPSDATRSTRRYPAVWLLAMVGVMIGSIAASLFYGGGQWVRGAMLSASDFLMISDTGPQLGMRSDPTDIVLVHYGRDSAERLGTKPIVETDRKVLAELLGAGATAIADPRLIASLLPEDFEPVARPTLEMMRDLDGGRGRVVREIMLGSMVDYETIRGFDDFIRHESISMRSPVDSDRHSRVCPIADHDLFVMRETMAVWLMRRYKNLDNLIDDGVEDVISQCGMAGVWRDFFPQMENLLSECDFDPPVSAYKIGDRSVSWFSYEGQWPQVAPFAFWIDHTQRVDSFQLLDYGDVAEGDFDADAVRGKLVVIGLDPDFVQSDLRFRVPSQREQVGNSVMLALATQTLISGRFMKEMPFWMYMVIPIVLSCMTAILVGRCSPLVALVGGVAILVAYFGIAILGYRSSWFSDMAMTPVSIVLAAIAAGVTRYGYEIRWRNRMTDLFGRYVPRAVVSDLISKRSLQAISVGGTRRDVTVMFADIRGFTRFTEGNEPETVLDRLNEFLGIMVDCTFEQDGTVDKFIGDAILVLFNAPTDQPDHALRAVKTAWSIQSRLNDFLKAQDSKSAASTSGLSIGIGIHTGVAIVGTVGTPQRLEYTAIGSTVNTASRLCDKAAGGTVVVSKEVTDAVGDAFRFRENEPMEVKGIDRPLMTATVIGPAEPSDSPN